MPRPTPIPSVHLRSPRAMQTQRGEASLGRRAPIPGARPMARDGLQEVVPSDAYRGLDDGQGAEEDGIGDLRQLPQLAPPVPDHQWGAAAPPRRAEAGP